MRQRFHPLAGLSHPLTSKHLQSLADRLHGVELRGRSAGVSWVRPMQAHVLCQPGALTKKRKSPYCCVPVAESPAIEGRNA